MARKRKGHIAIAIPVAAVMVPLLQWAGGAAASPSTHGWKRVGRIEANGVSCVSRSSCHAANNYLYAWTGRRWKKQPRPTPPSVIDDLFGMSCVSSNRCWASGNFNGQGVAVYALDRRHWTTQAAPTQSLWSGDGISCGSARFCLLVGVLGTGGHPHALVERWNGSRWSRLTVPTRTGDGLISVTCPSPRFCVAVGWSHTERRPLALIWKSGRWTRSVPPAPRAMVLEGVSCPTTRLCISTGGPGNGDLSRVPLIDRWASGRWSRESPPASPNGDLSGVSCPSSSRCVAVGEGFSQSTRSTGLIESWNGSAWMSTLIGSGQLQLDGSHVLRLTSAWPLETTALMKGVPDESDAPGSPSPFPTG